MSHLHSFLVLMYQVNKTESSLSTAKKAYKNAIDHGTQRMQQVLRKAGVRSAVERTNKYYMAWQTLKYVLY